jgi:hypothetical protein
VTPSAASPVSTKVVPSGMETLVGYQRALNMGCPFVHVLATGSKIVTALIPLNPKASYFCPPVTSSRPSGIIE